MCRLYCSWIGIELGDKSRIGRLALDWQIGIGLAYESKFAT